MRNGEHKFPRLQATPAISSPSCLMIWATFRATRRAPRDTHWYTLGDLGELPGLSFLTIRLNQKKTGLKCLFQGKATVLSALCFGGCQG